MTLASNRRQDSRTNDVSVRGQNHPDTTPYPNTAADVPKVRLICLPWPGAQIPYDPEAPRVVVNGRTSSFGKSGPTAVLIERHRLTPRSSADVEVVVDFRGWTGPSAYRVEVRVGEDGGSRVVPVNGDAPMFGTEDGGGMGYWPATALWTMSPTRTHTYCDAVSNPAPDQKPTCS